MHLANAICFFFFTETATACFAVVVNHIHSMVVYYCCMCVLGLVNIWSVHDNRLCVNGCSLSLNIDGCYVMLCACFAVYISTLATEIGLDATDIDILKCARVSQQCSVSCMEL